MLFVFFYYYLFPSKTAVVECTGWSLVSLKIKFQNFNWKKNEKKRLRFWNLKQVNSQHVNYCKF